MSNANPISAILGRLAPVAVLSVFLAGCAASVISSNSRTVVVDPGKPPRYSAAVQALADAECKKHGRQARLTGEGTMGFVFDCVE